MLKKIMNKISFFNITITMKKQTDTLIKNQIILLIKEIFNRFL
jgi:hypothetical protein